MLEPVELVKAHLENSRIRHSSQADQDSCTRLESGEHETRRGAGRGSWSPLPHHPLVPGSLSLCSTFLSCLPALSSHLSPSPARKSLVPGSLGHAHCRGRRSTSQASSRELQSGECRGGEAGLICVSVGVCLTRASSLLSASSSYNHLGSKKSTAGWPTPL